MELDNVKWNCQKLYRPEKKKLTMLRVQFSSIFIASNIYMKYDSFLEFVFLSQKAAKQYWRDFYQMNGFSRPKTKIIHNGK